MQSPRRAVSSLWRCVAVGVVFLCAAASVRADDWNWNHDENDYHGDWNNDHRDNDNHRHDNRNDNQDITERQKRACEPEVFRLCGWYIPNRDRITACLRKNIDRLNADCRAVMEGRLR